jgi:hypothetical protein
LLLSLLLLLLLLLGLGFLFSCFVEGFILVFKKRSKTENKT